MKTTTSFISRAALACLAVFAAATSAQAQDCPGMPKLKIDTHTLDFSENKPVCVRANGIFKIRLKAQNDYQLDYDDVTVREKAGSTDIRKVDVNSQGVMQVQVGNFTVGTEPEYKIVVTGVGQLDPRVRIIPSYQALSSNFEAIENHLLDQYQLSLSGLLEMDRYLREEYHTSVADVLDTIRKSPEQSR
jgi:hypothetical protein